MADVDRIRDKISTELIYEKELLVFSWGDAFDQLAGATGGEHDGGNARTGGDGDERTPGGSGHQ